MSFVKGHARACTALAMALIVMDHFPDAAALTAVGGGNLLESLKAIRVRVAIVNQDLLAVAFKNALYAHRGSIRQPHDVLTWIQKLEKVSAAMGERRRCSCEMESRVSFRSQGHGQQTVVLHEHPQGQQCGVPHALDRARSQTMPSPARKSFQATSRACRHRGGFGGRHQWWVGNLIHPSAHQGQTGPDWTRSNRLNRRDGFITQFDPDWTRSNRFGRDSWTFESA